MSHSVRLNKDLGVVVLRAKDMDFNECRNVLDELVRIPGFKAGLSLVADFRGTNSPITAEEVRTLADYAQKTDADWGVTKWAIVASESLSFGLSRMFAALTDECQVTTHVFHNVTDADDWLGLGVEIKQILALTPA